MKNKIVLLMALVASPSFGATYLNWGIAQDYPGGGSYSDVQTYSVGLLQKSSRTFNTFEEVGGWKDPGHFEGAKPSLFVAGGLVLNLDLVDRYVSYSLGPSCISTPDTLLGSKFQVYHKLAIGYQEKNKRIGLFIKHFSNAGMTKINYGRNFVGLEIGF